MPHTPTLGSPVVPLVYMIVHRSLGAGGEAAAGLAAPSARNASHVCAVMPASLHACRQEGLCGIYPLHSNPLPYAAHHFAPCPPPCVSVESHD